jgi:hypothetical protein
MTTYMLTERHGRVVSTLDPYLGGPRFKCGPETDYGKVFRGCTQSPKVTTASFHVLCN